MKKKFDKRRNGLRQAYYKKHVRWQVDFDYVSQLIETAKHSVNPAEKLEAIEALEFLSQFCIEYYDKSNLKDKDALHGKKLRKAIYNALNATSRDVFSIQNSGGALVYDELEAHSENPEDSIIAYIDSKRGGQDDR